MSSFNFVTKCWFDIKRLLLLPTIRISCCKNCCLLHMPAFCSLAFWTICYLMMRGDLSLNMLGTVFAQQTHMLSFLENVFLKWISLHPVTSLHTHLYTFDDNQFHSYHHSTNAKSIWIVKKMKKLNILFPSTYSSSSCLETDRFQNVKCLYNGLRVDSKVFWNIQENVYFFLDD